MPKKRDLFENNIPSAFGGYTGMVQISGSAGGNVECYRGASPNAHSTGVRR